MPKAKSATAELEYETFGASTAPTVLLINGLGSQMTRWPADFCNKLAACGFQVIRFDNRDTGLSTWFKPGDSYSLSDMAADGIAVLDAVGADKAHVAGVSMGGMISQAIAIEHPGRVLSLTSIMSSSGAPGTMDPTPEAGLVLSVAPPDPKADYETFLSHGVNNALTIGSPGYPWPEGALRERASAEQVGGVNPRGDRHGVVNDHVLAEVGRDGRLAFRIDAQHLVDIKAHRELRPAGSSDEQRLAGNIRERT